MHGQQTLVPSQHPCTWHRLRLAGYCVLLAASDHPFSDLRVDLQGWLGPTVVSGEGQILQGRLTIRPHALRQNTTTTEINCPDIARRNLLAPISHWDNGTMTSSTTATAFGSNPNERTDSLKQSAAFKSTWKQLYPQIKLRSLRKKITQKQKNDQPASIIYQDTPHSPQISQSLWQIIKFTETTCSTSKETRNRRIPTPRGAL